MTSIDSSKLQRYEHETLLNILIIITIITLVLCVAGWYVEYSKALNKPNQDETEEMVMKQLLDAQEYVLKNPTRSADDLYQKYREDEIKLIQQKTFWGLMLLSFSPSRNIKRLFQLTIIQKRDIVIQIAEGMQAILLLWIIMGNTFGMSFYSFPVNFNS